ncbi:MAG: hypothetical protein IPJ88_08985 [Myxococcales bacterium]|nr:MAG: hypothetical protein IPJ88_08985 [Myxococcales bacterium]
MQAVTDLQALMLASVTTFGKVLLSNLDASALSVGIDDGKTPEDFERWLRELAEQSDLESFTKEIQRLLGLAQASIRELRDALLVCSQESCDAIMKRLVLVLLMLTIIGKVILNTLSSLEGAAECAFAAAVCEISHIVVVFVEELVSTSDGLIAHRQDDTSFGEWLRQVIQGDNHLVGDRITETNSNGYFLGHYSRTAGTHLKMGVNAACIVLRFKCGN